MGASQRRKGAAGERELANLLVDHLGGDVVRNLEQTRSGGHDLVGVDPFAIEVKRHETLAIPAWWRQACDQSPSDMIPALAYRQSRRPWRFVLPLELLIDQEWPRDYALTCEVGVEGFCYIAREIIADAA